MILTSCSNYLMTHKLLMVSLIVHSCSYYLALVYLVWFSIGVFLFL